MKKIILFLCLLLAGAAILPQSASAQQNIQRSTVFKVNVLSPFAATGSGFLEHAFSPRISGQLGAYITGVTISDVEFSGYGFTPEVRYYLSENKNAPAGPYLAGYARILNYELKVENEAKATEYTATYKPIGAGVAAGNQWIFNNGIAVDIFLGINYNSGSLKINTGTEDDFDTGFLNIFGSGMRIRPGLTVGYSF